MLEFLAQSADEENLGAYIYEGIGAHEKIGPSAADEAQGIIARLHVLPEMHLSTKVSQVEQSSQA